MGLSASSVAHLSLEELKSAKCQLLFGSAEKVLRERLLNFMKDNSSSIHQHLAAIVIDASHTVEMWTGKWYFLITRFSLADLYGGPHLPWQNLLFHGKTYFSTAKLSFPRQNFLFHGKTFFSTAKLYFSPRQNLLFMRE